MGRVRPDTPNCRTVVTAQRWTLTARWVLPVTAPPLPNGVLTVDGETIAAVELAGARPADLDLGDAAVIPGLVNAHTHLDLTGMRGLAPPRLPLPDWLRQVIAHRRTRSPEQVAADIQTGLAECVRTGTTLVGDISGDGGSWDALAASPIRAVVFRELIGLTGDGLRAASRAAVEWARDRAATPTCRPGLSPHAPYSVHRQLYHMLTSLAWPYPLPLATHLGESSDELDLLTRRAGPFVPFLQGLGVWNPDGLAEPYELGSRLGLADRAPLLLAHCNYLGAYTIPGNATVVYCPRTHAAFGHPPHPFREFLARGIRVALGTDSLASNPDLDLLAEARFLRQQTDLSGEAILRLATIAGAEALGFGDVTGSLTPGKSADLVVVPLPPGRVGGVSPLLDSKQRANAPRSPDPYDLVLASDLPVSRVLCRGRWVSPGV
jgi:cytosine/adenosine deaminase-related metal-dependent hydrolase